MEYALGRFMKYIQNEKHMSENTVLSYHRDLKKLCSYLHGHGIDKPKDITSTNLTSFVLYLEESGFSSATISRTIASVKSFVTYLFENKEIDDNVSKSLKAPKVERKKREALSTEDMFLLLEQPDENTNKGIRDKAMLELLCSTGIRVTQLIALQINDVNLKLGFVTCDGRTVQISREAQKSLAKYLSQSRSVFEKTKGETLVFFNCSGGPMSRQGFWKMLKGYAVQAGITSDITPNALRNFLK